MGRMLCQALGDVVPAEMKSILGVSFQLKPQESCQAPW